MDTVAQEYFNVAWPLCLKEASVTHVFPEIIFAQSAVETGYGLHHPQNNYFGIKGSGENLSTVEVVNGVANKVMQHFAGYASMAASFAGYASFILRNRRYKTFHTDGSISAQLVALGTSGYATDPNYAMKVGRIVDLVPEYLAASPYGSQTQAVKQPIPQTRINPASLATTEDKQTMDANTTTVVTTDPVADLSHAKPVHQTGFLADLGHEADQLIVDPIKALVAHKSALQVAANLITGLLPYAPIPPGATAAITDIVNGITNLAKAPVPATATTMEQPSPVAADPVATDAEAAPALNPILADAIADGEELLSEFVGDFLAGNFTKQVAINQAEAEAFKAIGQAEQVFAPELGIAKNPNAN